MERGVHGLVRKTPPPPRLCALFGLTLTILSIVAYSFGRQPMLSATAHAVPRPAEIDDEYLSETGEGAQPDGIPSIIAAFIHTLRLINIRRNAEPVLHTITHGGADLVNRNLGALVEINTTLDELVQQLPDFLRKSDLPSDGPRGVAETPGTACFQMQSDALSSACVPGSRHCVLLCHG